MKLYRISLEELEKYESFTNIFGFYRYVGIIGIERQYEFLGNLVRTQNGYRGTTEYSFSMGQKITYPEYEMLYVEFNDKNQKMNESMPTNIKKIMNNLLRNEK